ncbi:diaminopimelate decarboxylase [soil metagenome]
MFQYHKKNLYAEDVAVAEIVRRWGTPCYIYSRTTLINNWQSFASALGSTQPQNICYAVKANANLAVLQTLAKLNSGFDIVSGGELERVIAAGGDPHKVIFSGVGKLHHEFIDALKKDIRCFNIESESELHALNLAAAKLGKCAPVALRVNPNIDAETHPYIATGLKENKFGIDIDDALAIYKKAAVMSHIKITGLACHIGSQLTKLNPFLDTLATLLQLLEKLKAQGITIQHLDMGGGLGIKYQGEQPPTPAHYITALREALQGHQIELIVAPGRAISATAGILVTRVEYLKHANHKNFIIVDAAMNDLMRPALYQAWHDIIPVSPRKDQVAQMYDVVGPVCETGDFLGKERQLAVQPNDLLAIANAGAYGFAMSSNYNTRPRAPEIMVDGDKAYLVRKRETVAELFAGEYVLA